MMQDVSCKKQIVSLYRIRWSRNLGGSRDLVNKLHVYWRSNYAGQLLKRGLIENLFYQFLIPN